MSLRIRFHDWIDRHFGTGDPVRVDEDRAQRRLYGARQSTMIQWPITPAADRPPIDYEEAA